MKIENNENTHGLCLLEARVQQLQLMFEPLSLVKLKENEINTKFIKITEKKSAKRDVFNKISSQ